MAGQQTNDEEEQGSDEENGCDRSTQSGFIERGTRYSQAIRYHRRTHVLFARVFFSYRKLDLVALNFSLWEDAFAVLRPSTWEGRGEGEGVHSEFSSDRVDL